MDEVNIKNLINGNLELNRYVEFSLGQREFAIPLLMVREVISIPETTAIPNSPAHFFGIINLRGQVISVIFLRKKLIIEDSIKSGENSKKREEVIIIVSIGKTNIGVVVDSINNVLAISSDNIKAMPETDHKVDTNYISGIYHKKDSLVVLLNMALVLNIKDNPFIQTQIVSL